MNDNLNDKQQSAPMPEGAKPLGESASDRPETPGTLSPQSDTAQPEQTAVSQPEEDTFTAHDEQPSGRGDEEP